MHRNNIGIMVVAVFACAVLMAGAATPSGTITRESMVSSEVLNRLSVGVDYVSIDREVQGSGVKDSLQARVFSGYVGYDALPWVTVFATLGGCQIDDNSGYWSSGTKWTLGVAPNLWEGDLRRPSFLAGKISISGLAEIGSYESSEGGASADWMEYTAGILLRYEVFEDAPWSADSVTSLRLSVGPAFSMLKGDVKNSGAKWSFDESESVGWLATVEWFLAPTFSIAGGAEMFDEASVSASIRLHF